MPLCIVCLSLLNIAKAQPSTDKYAVTSATKSVVRSFPLSSVRLLDGPFKQTKDNVHDFLLDWEADRLLHWHRKAAGLEPKAEHYGGWDNGGSNMLGHYLTACAHMYATTGDEHLLKQVNYIVDELALCQQNQESNAVFNGVGMEEAFQKIQRGDFTYKLIGPEFPMGPGGNPWYGIHKNLAGLRDAYLFCDNEKAKEVLIKYTDWINDFVQSVPADQFQRHLDVEHGGICQTIADVYALTGDQKYLDLAKKFVHHRVADPVAANRDMLYPHHANTQVPKFAGYARFYELAGEKTAELGKAAFNFWDMVVHNHMNVIGGNSEYERFGPSGEISKRIGFSSSETCNTYNMLKLSNQLYELSGDVKYMDYYERALYNHILASVGPKQGAFCYYVSTKPGWFKTYSTPFNSNWCCVGTGLENPGKYEEAIYAHDDTSVYVNLFIASELNWKEQQFTLQQQTRFPESDTVHLTVTNPGKQNMALKIRQPYWVSESMQIWINEKPVSAKGKNGYINLSQKWKKGDRIMVVLPMKLHIAETPDNEHIGAVLYGPIVLAGALGKEGIENLQPYAEDMWEFKDKPALEDIPVLIGDKQHPADWIKPVASKPLHFTVQSADKQAVTLMPFYKVHLQRYALYWDMFTPQQWKEYTSLKTQEVKDEVVLGDTTSEAAHHWKGEKTTSGKTFFRTFRSAEAGGWFSYRMRADSQEPLYLVCQYWGGGWGENDPKGIVEIYVDDHKIATTNLTDANYTYHPTVFYEVIYPIPQGFTKNKETVTVRFQPKSDTLNSGPFTARVVTAPGLNYNELLKDQ